MENTMASSSLADTRPAPAEAEHSKPVEATKAAERPMREDAYSAPQREVPTTYGKVGVMNVPGYEDLAAILIGAYEQSAKGKGLQRHAKGNTVPFKDQRILALARDAGIGAHTYQISKKAMEAGDMVGRGDFQAAIHEFRGVIVYAAAAILLAAELEQKSGQKAQN
jgi:hypothetical protein